MAHDVTRPDDSRGAAPDLRAIRARLEALETPAAALPWDRRWRVSTHVWTERGLPCVDLHDLNVALALEAVRIALPLAEASGAVIFITGRGRRSISKRSALREACMGRLRSVARDRGWRLQPQGPGRLVLVADPTADPARIGPWGWVMAAAFGGAVALACPPAGPLIAAAVAGLCGVGLWRSLRGPSRGPPALPESRDPERPALERRDDGTPDEGAPEA